MVLGLAAAHHMMLYRDMQPFEASILLTRPFAPMMIISIWGLVLAQRGRTVGGMPS